MLLLGMLGPPGLWALRFGFVYVLVPYACANEWMWVLHAITAATILAVATIGAVSWNRWRAAVEADGEGSGEIRGRRRFMALAGLLSSAFFLAVIVAEGLANFFIHPCQQAGVPIV